APPPGEMTPGVKVNSVLASSLASSFTGPSEKLSRTAIVPTLESPIPPGKSAIWCASLLFAWQHLEKEVLKGPRVLAGARDLSRRLSKAPRPGVRSDDAYVTAGFVKDGIVERIRRELPLRFPKAPAMAWVPPNSESGALAYAYLEVAIRF